MEAIRKLLQNHPGLLPVGTAGPEREARKQRYERVIADEFDKLEDVAEEAQALIMKLQHWRMEAGEKVFEFARAIRADYALDLADIHRLFNEVLHQRSRGPLLGFLVSGAYHEIIRDSDVLSLDLRKYSGAISGLGYKHPRGRLEMVGNRAFYVGAKMAGGEVVLRGNAANHVGRHLLGGRLLIEGNTRNWIGQQMHGGVIMIRGNAGEIIGKDMTGGEIVIGGDAGGWIGDGMKNGVIRIRGERGPIDEDRTGGEIFEWRSNQWSRVD